MADSKKNYIRKEPNVYCEEYSTVRLLPEETTKLFSGCAEKINSYLVLADYGLPILKSVYVSREDFDTWTETIDKKIRKHLHSERTMLRYIYRIGCHKIKNGGNIVLIQKDSIKSEVPVYADVWLLEPVQRTDNQYCFNFCIDRDIENIHIEILGKGFDISDLNKGIISAQEIVDMPFPLEEGVFGEWWKWARISICTQADYHISRTIRKERLEMFDEKMILPEKFIPMPLELLDKIRHYIRLIEPWVLNSGFKFVNISCSVLNSGRFIFWDIQTPEGKIQAYL